MPRMSDENQQLWLQLLCNEGWVTASEFAAANPAAVGRAGHSADLRMVLESWVHAGLCSQRTREGTTQYSVTMQCRPPSGVLLRDIFRVARVPQ